MQRQKKIGIDGLRLQAQNNLPDTKSSCQHNQQQYQIHVVFHIFSCHFLSLPISY